MVCLVRLSDESLCDTSGGRNNDDCRGIGVCEPDAVNCAARAAPAAVRCLLGGAEPEELDALAAPSSLSLRPLEPPLELVEGMDSRGAGRAGAFDGACRGMEKLFDARTAGAASGIASGSALALTCACVCGLLFRKRLGALEFRLGPREFGRDASRNVCADACAARFADERPACCAGRASVSSAYCEPTLDDDRDACGRGSAMARCMNIGLSYVVYGLGSRCPSRSRYRRRWCHCQSLSVQHMKW